MPGRSSATMTSVLWPGAGRRQVHGHGRDALPAARADNADDQGAFLGRQGLVATLPLEVRARSALTWAFSSEGWVGLVSNRPRRLEPVTLSSNWVWL